MSRPMKELTLHGTDTDEGVRHQTETGLLQYSYQQDSHRVASSVSFLADALMVGDDRGFSRNREPPTKQILSILDEVLGIVQDSELSFDETCRSQ
eukprot:scaffold1172_cov115-Cylindrotheca_fusiformis.AAC.15